MKFIYIFLGILIIMSLSSCKKTYADLERAIEDENDKKIMKLIKDPKIATQDNLKLLAETNFPKSKDFKLLKLLCDNGMSVNTALKLKEGSLVSEKKLIYIAFEYYKTDFIDYLLQNNVDLTSPCNGYHDFLCCDLYQFDGLYFDRLVEKVGENDWDKIDLDSIINHFLIEKNFKYIDKLFQIKSVANVLEKSESFVPLIAKNFTDELIQYVSQNFDLNSLNFSDKANCIYNAVMSENPQSLKWIIDSGVPVETKLDWYGEGCSIDFYIYEYFNHLSNYSDLDRAIKINNFMSVYKNVE